MAVATRSRATFLQMLTTTTSSLQSKSSHNIDDDGYDESESLLLGNHKPIGASKEEIHNNTSDYSYYNVKRIVTILMLSIVLLIITLARRFQNKMNIPPATIDNNIIKELQISNYINLQYLSCIIINTDCALKLSSNFSKTM